LLDGDPTSPGPPQQALKAHHASIGASTGPKPVLLSIVNLVYLAFFATVALLGHYRSREKQASILLWVAVFLAILAVEYAIRIHLYLAGRPGALFFIQAHTSSLFAMVLLIPGVQILRMWERHRAMGSWLEFGTFGDQASTLRARIAKFREDLGRREILASDRAFGYRCLQDYVLVGVPGLPGAQDDELSLPGPPTARGLRPSSH
jgi:hypothetical protein